MIDTKPTALGPVEARRRRPPAWWRPLRAPVLVVAGVAAALVSTAAMWGLNIYLAIDEGRPPGVEIADLDAQSDFAHRPRNVLLLGSDSRAGLSEEEQAAFGTEESVEGERSDTIILMHIDPRLEKAVVVHFPRDLRVDIPGHGTDKINAAYELGGPELTVRTVKQFTGLPIHNYMEIDLAGFENLVDVLGGVRLCVDRPLYDELAGLSIPKKGCYTFDGRTALAFVRARHIEGDLIPDFSRIARQQQFMRAMLNKILSVGSLLDQRVIEEAARHVRTDTTLSTADLLLLGSELRKLAEEDPSGASSLDFRVVPGTPRTLSDGVSYVIPDQDEAERLFRALEKGKPLGTLGATLAGTLPSPGVIKVKVLSAGSTTDADEAEGVLRRAGFIVLESGAAPAGTEDSEILFRPGAGPRAQVVAGYFEGLPRRLTSASILGDAEVAVVVGDGFRTVAG